MYATVQCAYIHVEIFVCNDCPLCNISLVKMLLKKMSLVSAADGFLKEYVSSVLFQELDSQVISIYITLL